MFYIYIFGNYIFNIPFMRIYFHRIFLLRQFLLLVSCYILVIVSHSTTFSCHFSFSLALALAFSLTLSFSLSFLLSLLLSLSVFIDSRDFGGDVFAQICEWLDSDAVINCANGFRMNLKMPHDLHHNKNKRRWHRGSEEMERRVHGMLNA